MENIKIVLVLIFNIVLAVSVNIGILIKLAKYISRSRNNNVTGENIYVYETIPFMEKYHIRERLGRGERHRMPKAPKRHEIKYWWIGMIFTVVYVVCSLITGFGFLNISSLLFVSVISGGLLDRLAHRKIRWFCILVRIIGILVAFKIAFIDELSKLSGVSNEVVLFIKDNQIINILKSGINSLQLLTFDFKSIIIIWIPIAILLVILLYSLIKRKLYSVTVIILCCLYTTLVYLFIIDVAFAYIMPVTLVSYLYLTMLIFQKIYNIKALKKIRIIS